MSTSAFCTNFLNTPSAIPPTPDRTPNPHSLEKKKRVSGSKNPHFPSPSHDLEKGDFLTEKRGLFDRKLPFPGRGEMRVFGPRNPLFQETGIRGPVCGPGNPNTPTGPGHPSKTPGTSQQKSLETQAQQTFEGGNELLDSHLRAWLTPTPLTTARHCCNTNRSDAYRRFGTSQLVSPVLKGHL